MIEESTLRILNSKGHTIGTGFLASKTLVVTCAHVVIRAGLDGENKLRVQFTGAKQPIIVTALGQFEDLKRDVAILKLESIPDGIQPLSMGLAEHSRPGNTFRSFGYATAAELQGIFANGTVDGYQREHKLVQLQSAQANHGMSGAPVWDERRGVVIGIITKGHTELGRNENTTFATPAELIFKTCPEIQPDETCPYLGLESFSAETERFFFGRTALTEKLLTPLSRACRFLAVFGPSGSGKSSVVRAGLLPALKKDRVPGSQHWGQITIRPAEDPFAQLNAKGLDLSTIPETKTVLFIDQFEELFTCPEDRCERFVRELAAALENPQLTLVIAMRDDFYSTFNAKAAALAASPNKVVVDVPVTLERADLVAIIEQPAAAVGLALEEGLTEAIIKDAAPDGAARSSSLPLLEFALTQLWDKRREGLLTHDAYQAIGGVTGSLARWADEAYSDLPKAQQPLAESLLTALVHLGDEAQGLPDTRRRRALTDFDEPTRHVITHFTNRRLLITSGNTVELIHDTLVREWGQLQSWIKTDHAQLRVLEGVSEASNAWSAMSKNTELLVHRGERLDDALKLKKRLSRQERVYLTTCKMNEQRGKRNVIVSVSLFLMILIAVLTSWSFNSYESAKQLSYKAATAEAASALSIESLATAQSERDRARIGELVALDSNLRSTNFSLSLLISAEVFQRLDNYQTRDLMLNNLQISTYLEKFLHAHPTPVYKVLFSPDASLFATLGQIVVLWDAKTNQPIGKPITGSTNWISSIAFSPNGQTLAIGNSDGTVFFLDLISREQKGILDGENLHSIESIAFSPNGKTIATGSCQSYNEGSICIKGLTTLWDVPTSKKIGENLVGNASFVDNLVFSSDGRFLVSGGGNIIIWNVNTRKIVGRPIEADNLISNAVFSPDGESVVYGDYDGNIMFWDISRQKISLQFGNSTNQIKNIDISPDGKILATGDADNKIILWDLEKGQPLADPLLGHSSAVESLVFSPDGKRLVSGSCKKNSFCDQGEIIVWNLNSEQFPIVSKPMSEHSDWVYSIAFSPDGKTLASGGNDNNLILWDINTHQPISKQSISVYSLAFSPDGRTLASGSNDPFISLWNGNSLIPIRKLFTNHSQLITNIKFSQDGKILVSIDDNGELMIWDAENYQLIKSIHTGYSALYGLAISPDNKTIATGSIGEQNNPDSYNGEIMLWDTDSGKPTGQPFVGHQSTITGIVFSLDGKTLITSSMDSSIILWDITTRQAIRQQLLAHSGPIEDIAMAIDGKTIASGGDDKSVILWDISANQPIGKPLLGHSGALRSLAFSPDGKLLATAGQDNIIILWDVDSQSWLHKICDIIGRSFTSDEWTLYFPDEPYHATCSISSKSRIKANATLAP